MGKAYSLDFRLQVLKSFKRKRGKLGSKNWGSLRKATKYVMKLYNITERTLYYWLKKEKEGNLDNNNKNSGKKQKIDNDKLLKLINSEEGKDLTLKELANKLNVKLTTIYYSLKRNNITFKKNSKVIKKATL
jgi:transposase